MEPIEELELLAKWRGYLEGRALDFTKERLDAALIDRTLPPQPHDELRAALRALRTLERLTQNGHIEQARLLELHYVKKGEVARHREKNSAAQRKLTGLARGAMRQKQQQTLQTALELYTQHQR